MAAITKTILIITEPVNKAEPMSLRQRHHRATPTASIFFILFAASLMALAIPGLASQYYRQQAAAVVFNVTQGKADPETEVLNEATQNLKSALWFEPTNQTIHNNLATLNLRLQEKLVSGGKQVPALLRLAQAHKSFLSGLRHAPGNSNLWYLAGETNNRLNKPDERSQAYLQMSYLTGQREYWVMRRRSEFALRLWQGLNNDIRQMLQREVQSLSMKDLGSIYQNAGVSQKIIILREMGKNKSKDKFLRYIRNHKKQSAAGGYHP